MPIYIDNKYKKNLAMLTLATVNIACPEVSRCIEQFLERRIGINLRLFNKQAADHYWLFMCDPRVLVTRRNGLLRPLLSPLGTADITEEYDDVVNRGSKILVISLRKPQWNGEHRTLFAPCNRDSRMLILSHDNFNQDVLRRLHRDYREATTFSTEYAHPDIGTRYVEIVKELFFDKLLSQKEKRAKLRVPYERER